MTPDTSTRRLSPEEVGALSDEDLSARVVTLCFGGFGGPATEQGFFTRWSSAGPPWWVDPRSPEPVRFCPSNPGAVVHVIEHMRERWERAGMWGSWRIEYFPEQRKWWAGYCEPADVIGVGDRETWTAGSTALGRAVFESAVLSAQEMQPSPRTAGA